MRAVMPGNPAKACSRGGYDQPVRYPVVLDQNDDGSWTVTCPVLPGCVSEGDTRTAALHSIRDAIRLYLRAVKKELAAQRRKGKQIAQVAA